MHYHYFTLEQRAALEQAIRASLPARPEMRSALERLHTPEYGVCTKCTRDIAFARLAEDPAATLCRSCA